MSLNLAVIKFFFALVFFLFLSRALSAQNGELYQLVEAVEALPGSDDSNADSLLNASAKYLDVSSDSLSAQLNFAWGKYYHNRFRFDSTRIYLEQAVDGFQKAEVSDEKLGDAYYALGNLYYDIQDIAKAVNTYYAAMTLYEKAGDRVGIAKCYNTIANSYAYLNEFNLAERNYKTAIKMHKANKDTAELCKVIGNLGSLYTVKKDYETALETYEEALPWSKRYPKNRMNYMMGIGIVKEEIKAFSEAETYYRNAVTLAQELKDYVQLAYIYHNLAYLYVNTDQLDSVPKYLQLTEDLIDDYPIAILEFNVKDIRHKYLFKKGAYQQAYELLNEVRQENDSLYNVKLTRELQEVQAQYGSLKKEKELAQKDLELAATSNQLNKNITQRNALIMGLIIVLLVVFIVLRGRWVRERANAVLRQKNHEIQEKNKEIKAIEEAKSKWFINISHELRTPLTLIKGPIRQALNSIPSNDLIYKDLTIADRNVNHLQKLVDEILDLSKMEDGKMTMNRSKVNVIELILNSLAAFDYVARNVRVKLELDLNPEQPVFMKIDREKITNVLTNLVSNALKFTHEGGRVTAGFTNGEDCVSIWVEDTGEGISKQDLAKVFDRFYQAGIMSRQGGTGVGLALCLEIAKMHEGSIDVVSEIGKGSRFELKLPSKLVVDIEQEDLESETGEEPVLEYEAVSTEYRSLLKGKKILIVDDNEDMRGYISGFLKADFEILEARDGVEGIEVLQRVKPDLIVSDIMMPRMDGVSFARKVKTHPIWKGIPFVTVSAIGDETEKVNTLRIGIDDYLVKPFFAEELQVRIQNLISNYAQRQDAQADAEEELPEEERILRKLEQEVYDNIDDASFNVLRLVEAAAMSERQLYRFISKMTGLTPANFVKEIRLQKAMELIQKRVYRRTSQLSYAVGFQQPAYFSSVFKKRFGRVPADYLGDN